MFATPQLFYRKNMNFLVLVTDVDGMETPQLSQLMYGGDGDYNEDASRER